MSYTLIDCTVRLLIKVVNVFGAKKNLTYFSNYGSISTEIKRKKKGGRLIT